MAYAALSTVVTGTGIASSWGNQIKANFDAAFPLGVTGWTSYTPTLTQSGAVTKTVTYAKYQRVGRLITVTCFLTVTGSGTANNPVIVGLPVAAASSTTNLPMGTMFVFDNGTAWYHGVCLLSTTTSVWGLANADNVYLGQTGGDFAAALANTDVVGINVTYEAAS